tara:strand:+ start:323 stop:661 length:339 start_codon:yes stop_codon:yes gene_type:complete
MTNLEITLSIILLFSILTNVGLFMYARAAIVRLVSVAEELFDLKEMSDSLAEHLESVYELEMFYGDETLGGLMEHAKSFAEQQENFEYIYGLILEDDNTDTSTSKEEETEAS